MRDRLWMIKLFLPGSKGFQAFTNRPTCSHGFFWFGKEWWEKGEGGRWKGYLKLLFWLARRKCLNISVKKILRWWLFRKRNWVKWWCSNLQGIENSIGMHQKQMVRLKTWVRGVFFSSVKCQHCCEVKWIRAWSSRVSIIMEYIFFLVWYYFLIYWWIFFLWFGFIHFFLSN